ncbi:uncharacterized protein B0H64DRAFT_385061 [Chaetomium fimeti]|uniref:Uncharacterized protein n=1 Tax=Chaetomium fimeti TaxID=1854472 RepID=A0AAE0HKX2_9PEZI|nr:hypothetical protein B0H64DRAFT_385061 [Chaetomium fimeti]
MKTAVRGRGRSYVVLGGIVLFGGGEGIQVTCGDMRQGNRGWCSAGGTGRLCVSILVGVLTVYFTALACVSRAAIHVLGVAGGMCSSTSRLGRAWPHKTNALTTTEVLCIIPTTALLASSG